MLGRFFERQAVEDVVYLGLWGYEWCFVASSYENEILVEGLVSM